MDKSYYPRKNIKSWKSKLDIFEIITSMSTPDVSHLNSRLYYDVNDKRSKDYFDIVTLCNRVYWNADISNLYGFFIREDFWKVGS